MVAGGLTPGLEVKLDPQVDIWARDFTTVFPNNPLQFRYTKAAQDNDQDLADHVQDEFNKMADKYGLDFAYTPLFNDGGNFIHNGLDKGWVSERFIDDNAPKTEAQLISELSGLLGIDIAILYGFTKEEDPLGHADGMGMMIDNTIILNDDEAYDDNEWKVSQSAGFENVNVVKIPFVKDTSEAFDTSFTSSCGTYVNAPVTDKAIYVPTFGLAQDSAAVAMITAHANGRQVIEIPSTNVCMMGGSARCLIWQVKGDNKTKLQAVTGEVVTTTETPVTEAPVIPDSYYDCTVTQVDTAINCADVVGFDQCSVYFSSCAGSCCNAISYENISPDGLCIGINNAQSPNYSRDGMTPAECEQMCNATYNCIGYSHNSDLNDRCAVWIDEAALTPLTGWGAFGAVGNWVLGSTILG
eukprot:UN33135